jgi:hypothetical protein
VTKNIKPVGSYHYLLEKGKDRPRSVFLEMVEEILKKKRKGRWCGAVQSLLPPPWHQIPLL